MRRLLFGSLALLTLAACGGGGFSLNAGSGGISAEAEGEADVPESVTHPGKASFATAADASASAKLDAISSLRTVGYRVSSDFHSDGKVRFAFIPMGAEDAAILSKDIYVSFDVKSNVPFPIEGSAHVVAVHRPSDAKPLQAVFDVDGSGSMSSTDPKRKRIDAALRFAETLGEQDERNEIAVYEFSDEVHKRSDLTTVPEITREQLAQVGSDGSTALHDSMMDSIHYLAENRKDGYQPAILLLTDGMDNASDATPADVIAAAQENDIVVYGVSLGGAPDVPGLKFVGPVQRYAAATDGIYTHVDEADRLVDSFETVALARTHGWVEVEATLEGLGGVFVPFSKMSFDVGVQSGGETANASFSFIVPLKLGG